MSTNPSEACMNYYFDPVSSPITTFVSSHPHNTMSCPFSGLYNLHGRANVIHDLVSAPASSNPCQAHREVLLHAGCSNSADLKFEAECGDVRQVTDFQMVNGLDEVTTDKMLRSEFTCHGQWEEAVQESETEYVLNQWSGDSNGLLLKGQGQFLLRPRSRRKILVLSNNFNFLCLGYTEFDGILVASASRNSCSKFADLEKVTVEPHFNITSSGPCREALTGKSDRIKIEQILTVLVTLFSLVKVL